MLHKVAKKNGLTTLTILDVAIIKGDEEMIKALVLKYGAKVTEGTVALDQSGKFTSLLSNPSIA